MDIKAVIAKLDQRLQPLRQQPLIEALSGPRVVPPPSAPPSSAPRSAAASPAASSSPAPVSKRKPAITRSGMGGVGGAGTSGGVGAG